MFLICALLPTYQLRFYVLGLPTTLLETMIVILFICWFIRKLKTQNSNFKTTTQILKSNGWLWLISSWPIIGLVAVAIAPDKWLALGHWRAYFLEPILLLLVIINLSCHDTSSATATSFNTFNTILLGLSLSALYISGWAIYQKITGQGMMSLETWQYPLTTSVRSTGPFPHSNFLGLFLGPLVVLFLGKLVEAFRNKTLLAVSYWLLAIGVSAAAIVFAKSEGAILGVISGLIFFLIFYLKKRPRVIFIAILLFAICYLLFLSPWQKTIWQKITFQDLSLQIRLNIWRGAINLIKAHPFFGAGLRGYQQLVSQYQQPFSLPGVEGVISNELHPYPHNLFLTLWTELGVLGLIVFLFIIFQFFKFGFQKLFRNLTLEIRNLEQTKNNKITIIALLSSMIVILIHGAVDTPYFKNDLAVIFWLIVGLLIIHSHKIDEVH